MEFRTKEDWNRMAEEFEAFAEDYFREEKVELANYYWTTADLFRQQALRAPEVRNG